MLTDIFARRYENHTLWTRLEERDSKFLVQSFSIISEQLYPYFINGNEDPKTKAAWTSLHDRLSRELGLTELSPKIWGHWATWNGAQTWRSGFNTLEHVCKTFLLAEISGSVTADRFMKERISFIELAFRQKEQEMVQANASLPSELLSAEKGTNLRILGTLRMPGNRSDALRGINEQKNNGFRAAVDELNTRIRQARYYLSYHNGFIQISSDHTFEKQIEQPFWLLISGPVWNNVDTDMKEAIDLRDNGGRDPAFYAARSLESAIKIISGQKGWTHGKENGTHNYLDNLRSKKNGEFINEWETQALKQFFTEVRNPFGHGPGEAKMPSLNSAQTDWAIGFCMIWIKNLIQRM